MSGHTLELSGCGGDIRSITSDWDVNLAIKLWSLLSILVFIGKYMKHQSCTGWSGCINNGVSINIQFTCHWDWGQLTTATLHRGMKESGGGSKIVAWNLMYSLHSIKKLTMFGEVSWFDPINNVFTTHCEYVIRVWISSLVLYFSWNEITVRKTSAL